MYQALYRKWRPRTFDDVVGQEHITATLKRQVETGRLSHAYLFIGTRGTGKTTCAKILARAVNCEHPVNGNPCNACAACRGIETGGILDVVELDAASNNRVDDVRALQDEAIFSPASVKKRVYIIDEVHMLSTAAFNALLKILEEPPEHLMFILCTTELHKVLPTIVSRCQRHSFKRIEPDAIAGRLSYVAAQEGMDLTPEAAGLLARMADGGMRDALSLLDQCSASDRIDAEAVRSAMGLAGSRRIGELFEAVCSRAPDRALELFDAMWKDGKDPAGILEELGDLMRDVLIMQVAPGSSAGLVSGVHEPDVLKRFAASISGGELMDGMDDIRSADLSGANPRRAAEMCLVRLCVPETGDSLAGLKNRVARLESAVRDGLPARESPPPSPAAYAPLAMGGERDERPAPSAQGTQAQPEEPPWFMDEDAPPEEPGPPLPPETPEPAPPREERVPPNAQTGLSDAPPAAAPPSAEETALWDELVRQLNGKMDMGAYAMIATASQSAGVLTGDKMTVYLSTPIAKMMLDTPATVSLFQQELLAMTGRNIRVVFTDGDRPAESGPDMSKLNELTRFSNFKIQ